MLKADLHIHTNASDGIMSPCEVVRWSNIKRLRAIGITDHDTVKGIGPALASSSYFGVEIVPGIELSTMYESEEIHILGYYINYKDKWFLSILDEIQDSRSKRAEKIVNKLNELGVNITILEVRALAGAGAIGRPHIARAMIERGYINNIKEAFDKYIGNGCPAYTERYKLSSEEAISVVKNVGGIPVIAHPGLIKDRANIGKVIELGIEGMEVFHPKHDSETIRDMLTVAESKKLLITGGSDCHGVKLNNEPILGSCSIDYKYVKMLKEAANIRIRRKRNGSYTV